MFAGENGLCLGAFWTSDLGAGEALSALAELLLRGRDLVGCVSGDLYPPCVSHLHVGKKHQPAGKVLPPLSLYDNRSWLPTWPSLEPNKTQAVGYCL